MPAPKRGKLVETTTYHDESDFDDDEAEHSEMQEQSHLVMKSADPFAAIKHEGEPLLMKPASQMHNTEEESYMGSELNFK